MNLILKEEFEQTVEKESYKTYEGYVTSRKNNTSMNVSVIESERSGGSSSANRQSEIKKQVNQPKDLNN
jgi:hypothetical protein